MFSKQRLSVSPSKRAIYTKNIKDIEVIAMQSKLTLSIDSDLIEYAREYAHNKGTSISQIVTNYFQTLQALDIKREEPSSKTDALRGILKTEAPKEPFNTDAYFEYLERKHLC